MNPVRNRDCVFNGQIFINKMNSRNKNQIHSRVLIAICF